MGPSFRVSIPCAWTHTQKDTHAHAQAETRTSGKKYGGGKKGEEGRGLRRKTEEGKREVKGATWHALSSNVTDLLLLSLPFSYREEKQKRKKSRKLIEKL